MAISYGTRTVLSNLSNIDSATNTEARAFGEIDNSAGAHGVNVHIKIPISASAITGSYDFYLVESQDGIEWTDGIDPSGSGDVAGKLQNATFLLSSEKLIYNASDYSHVELHYHLPFISKAKYVGFVVVNNSGQTIPTGSDGDSVSYTVS